MGGFAVLACVVVISLATATNRVYFLQAEEVLWNYLPTNEDCLMRVQPPTGDDLPPEFPCPNAHLPPPSSGGSVDDGHHHTHGVSAALQAIMGRSPGRSQPHVQQDGHAGHTYSLWVTRGSNRIGRVYKKAVYREYTDATFTRRKERGPDEVHLGALGPVIRAEVGDTIKVVFRNNVSFPCSIHAHGVFYRKADEGHGYSDGHSSPGDSVAPGQVYTYTWEVPERAGPGPNDMSSILWLYHSHVNEMTDTNAGLFGPIVITRKGYAKPDGSPIDVDREFVRGQLPLHEFVRLWCSRFASCSRFMVSCHFFLVLVWWCCYVSAVSGVFLLLLACGVAGFELPHVICAAAPFLVHLPHSLR